MSQVHDSTAVLSYGVHHGILKAFKIMNVDYLFKGYINAKQTGFRKQTTLVPSQAEEAEFVVSGNFCVFIPRVFVETHETWSAHSVGAKPIVAIAVLGLLLFLRSRAAGRIWRRLRKGALFCINKGTRAFSL